jgi:hypothetical protein
MPVPPTELPFISPYAWLIGLRHVAPPHSAASKALVSPTARDIPTNRVSHRHRGDDQQSPIVVVIDLDVLLMIAAFTNPTSLAEPDL